MSEQFSDNLGGLIAAWLAEPDDALGAFLRAVRLVLLKHPVAAQAAFRALAAEGRRYAQSSEGAAWRRRLAGSELVARCRDVWEIASLNMLDEHAPELLPSQYVDALCYAASLVDLEPRLARASEPRAEEVAS